MYVDVLYESQFSDNHYIDILETTIFTLAMMLSQGAKYYKSKEYSITASNYNF